MGRSSRWARRAADDRRCQGRGNNLQLQLMPKCCFCSSHSRGAGHGFHWTETSTRKRLSCLIRGPGRQPGSGFQLHDEAQEAKSTFISALSVAAPHFLLCNCESEVVLGGSGPSPRSENTFKKTRARLDFRTFNISLTRKG